MIQALQKKNKCREEPEYQRSESPFLRPTKVKSRFSENEVRVQNYSDYSAAEGEESEGSLDCKSLG